MTPNADAAWDMFVSTDVIELNDTRAGHRA
jgi:hypothetical protein